MNKDEIKNKFEKKDWNELKTHDSWIIFKVMADAYVDLMGNLAKVSEDIEKNSEAETKD